MTAAIIGRNLRRDNDGRHNTRFDMAAPSRHPPVFRGLRPVVTRRSGSLAQSQNPADLAFRTDETQFPYCVAAPLYSRSPVR
jgi:hypothetical protein